MTCRKPCIVRTKKAIYNLGKVHRNDLISTYLMGNTTFFHCTFVQMAVCSLCSRGTKKIACQVHGYASKILTNQPSRLGPLLEGATRFV